MADTRNKSPKFDNGTAMNSQALYDLDLSSLSENEINSAIGCLVLTQRTGNQNEREGASACLSALFEIRRLEEQKKSTSIQAAYLDAAKKAQDAADTQLISANKINESIRYAAWAAAAAAAVSAVGAIIQIFK